MDRVADHRRETISAVLGRMTAEDRESLRMALHRFALAAEEPVDGDTLSLLWPPRN